MSRILLLACTAAAFCRAQCVPLTDARILARDMASAVPAFSGLPPDLVLGYAPGAGRRTYSAMELARLAKRYGVALEPGAEACFARALEVLTRERVTAALEASMPRTHIELVDFSRQPVPAGELHFPLSGLPPDLAGAELLWRGSISGQSGFPVWAKVRIQVSGMRVTAIESLPPGRPIARVQLREEAYTGPPGFPDASQVVGLAPRRPIPAGAVIERQWLETPAEVLRGDTVRLEIRSGLARVVLAGQAQSSARRGEVIGVRNPANGRILRAMVESRGLAVVTAIPAPSADRGRDED